MLAVSIAVHLLALSGLFIARLFGPLFALSLTTRLALHDAEVQRLGFAPLAKDALDWFVDEQVVVAFGVLAALEFVVNHARGPRAWLLRSTLPYAACAAATAAGGLGIARDYGFLEGVLGQGATLALQAEPRLQGALEPALLGALAFVLVLGLARLRRRTLQRVAEQERDDPLGVGWLVAWTEDLWTVLWAPLFVVWPPSALLGLLIAVVALLRLRATLRVRDEDDKVICVCGQLNFRTAPRCAGCGGRNASPANVGKLGQATAGFASDLEAHARALYEVRRCPRCATPLEAREPQQFCTACGQAAPPDAVFVGEYDRAIRRRTGLTLLGTALWGAIPLVGLVPGIFFAHRRLIAPYARYVRRLRSMLLRIVLSVLWLVVIVTQLVPGVGALGLPLMAYASHRAQRASYLRGNAASADDDW